METFAKPKAFVESSHFKSQRQNALAGFDNTGIDAPIVKIINSFNNLPYCFTLQSCYGHFLYDGQDDPHHIAPLPDAKPIGRVEYRIAYVAFCIDCCDIGERLLRALKQITLVDSDNIQLCSAEWFWKKQVNTYALQVEPDRFKHQDTAVLDFEEALHVENVRNLFFAELIKLLQTV